MLRRKTCLGRVQQLSLDYFSLLYIVSLTVVLRASDSTGAKQYFVVVVLYNVPTATRDNNGKTFGTVSENRCLGLHSKILQIFTTHRHRVAGVESLRFFATL